MLDPAVVVQALLASPYFRGIPPAVLHTLAVQVEVKNLRPAETLVERGAPPGGIGMVAEGEVEIVRPGKSGEPTVTSKVGPGMWLGAVEVVEGAPSQATWRAQDRVRLWWFSEASCRRLLGDLGQAGTAFRRALILGLSRQLLASNDFLRRTAERPGS